MSTQDFAIDESATGGESRVVEAEFRLPKWDELHLPEIDLEPVRNAAEQVLLTTIGVGVLVARGIAEAVRAANQAGAEAAEDPGPLAKALLSLVRWDSPPAEPATQSAGVQVPVVPIDEYDALDIEAVLEAISSLSEEELCVVRDYEAASKNRTEVIDAIAGRLAAD